MDALAIAVEEHRLRRLEEALWVTEAQRGHSESFVQLMARYEKPLVYYLRRLVPEKEAVLDIHQEVWIDAFHGIRNLQAPEAFRVWIYRIAHRKAARFIRKELQQEQFLKHFPYDE